MYDEYYVNLFTNSKVLSIKHLFLSKGFFTEGTCYYQTGKSLVFTPKYIQTYSYIQHIFTH